MAIASRAKIQETQFERLRQQLLYCEKNVPYYKALFKDIGIEPAALRDLHQLERLPYLTKAIAREHHSALRGQAYLGKDVQKSFSSGSTGEPFATFFDTLSWYRKKYLVKLRARFACGMALRERVAILECDEADSIARRNSNTWLQDQLLKVRVFSLYEEPAILLDQLREFAPQNIYAYPSHLLELAQADLTAEPLIAGVKRLFTSSEFLSQGLKTRLEARYQAEIYDHYGSTEFKEIAWQCPEQGWYHINHEDVICEVVNEHGPVLNEPGEVVVTDLRNKAMPLLRFKLGDLAVKSNTPCGCGYSGDSIKPLGGRSSDYFVFEGGQEISPYRFTMAIEAVQGMLQYQLVQLGVNSIQVNIVWRNDELAAQADDVREHILHVLNEAGVQSNVSIDVRRCQSINNEENGKFKVVKRAFEQ